MAFSRAASPTRSIWQPAWIDEFDPEEVWNYELGFKMDAWEQKLRFNTAVFYTDYKDRQLTTIRISPERPYRRAP